MKKFRVGAERSEAPASRYLTYQNFYASVKMLNFWCENFFLEIQREKWTLETNHENQRQKKVTSKTKGKKSVKSLKKITKRKNPLKFICY